MPLDPSFSFILLRHCQKAGDALDMGLTDHGRACAVRLADALAAEGCDAIWCSPYGRAQETIAPFAARTGLPVQIDARLAEWQVSSTAIAQFPLHVEAMLTDPTYRPPFSETIAEVWSRMSSLLEEIAASGVKRPVLSAHGGVTGITLNQLGAAFTAMDWVRLAQPSLIRITGKDWDKVEIEGAVNDL